MACEAPSFNHRINNLEEKGVVNQKSAAQLRVRARLARDAWRNNHIDSLIYTVYLTVLRRYVTCHASGRHSLVLSRLTPAFILEMIHGGGAEYVDIRNCRLCGTYRMEYLDGYRARIGNFEYWSPDGYQPMVPREDRMVPTEWGHVLFMAELMEDLRVLEVKAGIVHLGVDYVNYPWEEPADYV